MLYKLKLLMVGLASLFIVSLPVVNVAALDCTNPTTAQDSLQCGSSGASGSTTQSPAQATDSFNHLITVLLNIMSAVVGILAVIMIVIAGARFVTSGGNAEGVKTAKSSLTYAIVGIIIAVTAQIVVKFVLNKTIKATQ